jgi:prolyl-tRNA editing enzyme YbaK/EbsC (Cys-tRNA(Pro) deacylase)
MEPKIQEISDLCVGCDYEIFKDPTLMANARVGAEHYGISLSECAPTFILKAGVDYLAVIIQGDRKLDFNKIAAVLGVKKVTMALREEILDVTGSQIGSVSLINPKLKTFVDEGISTLEYCYGGCGVENYTLKIKASDLIKLSGAVMGDFSKNNSNYAISDADSEIA